MPGFAASIACEAVPLRRGIASPLEERQRLATTVIL
jgi:hypothetical protein